MGFYSHVRVKKPSIWIRPKILKITLNWKKGPKKNFFTYNVFENLYYNIVPPISIKLDIFIYKHVIEKNRFQWSYRHDTM